LAALNFQVPAELSAATITTAENARTLNSKKRLAAILFMFFLQLINRLERLRKRAGGYVRLDRCSNGLSLHRHGVQTSYPSIDWVNMRSCVFSASVRGPMSDGGSAWSNFAKAALVVGAISVGLLITAVVIGVIWWNRHGQEFVSGVQDAMKQGQMEGQGIAEETCLERSIESIRSDRGIDMSLMVEKSLHLQGCLSTARVSRISA